jgi:hypothetical protein
MREMRSNGSDANQVVGAVGFISRKYFLRIASNDRGSETQDAWNVRAWGAPFEVQGEAVLRPYTAGYAISRRKARRSVQRASALHS